MLLLKKMAITIATLAISTTVATESQLEHYLSLAESQVAEVPPVYSRSLVDTQDYAWFGPTLPIDPQHLGMKAMGYTQAQVDAMDAEAATDFLVKYGFDFRLTNPAVIHDTVTGIRILPGIATWFPYISKDQAFIISDSTHPDRGNAQPWVNNKVGVQILFTGSGQFTAGLNTGAFYQAGDLFPFGEFNYLKVGGDPTNPAQKEVIKFRCSNLCKQTVNQWGDRQFIVSLDVIDAQDRQGIYISATEILKDLSTGAKRLIERPVSTWQYSSQQN